MSDTRSTAIRVVLAAAHDATLAGLRLALEDGPFELVAEVAEADAAAEAAERERPDVCLLDTDIPGDVFAATAKIARRVPSAGIVLFASERDEAAMLDAVRAGAVGYLLKDMDPGRLRYALQGVTQGEAAIPRTLVTRLITEFRLREHGMRLPVGTGGEAELTAREWDVLSLMADGATTRDMSGRLGIAEVTVRRHVSTVLAKLQVSDRDAAVQLLRATRRS
jgi:DNA-binding NarL/FixJ family response regulator